LASEAAIAIDVETTLATVDGIQTIVSLEIGNQVVSNLDALDDRCIA
jgi:hypothetical protein